MWLTHRLAGGWQIVRRIFRRREVPIEVLCTDQQRRRLLARELRVAVRRLRRTVGTPPVNELAIVAQQMLGSGRQLAGCTQLTHDGRGAQGAPGAHSTDGVTFALIRVALEVHGRVLSADEVLAALAEQWIGLVGQRAAGATVIVPVEFAYHQPADADEPFDERPTRPVRSLHAPAARPGVPAEPTPLRIDPLAPIGVRAPERNGLPT
jgi:hypothetical protein